MSTKRKNKQGGRSTGRGRADVRGDVRGRRQGRPGSPAAPSESVIYGWHSALAALNNPHRHIRRILVTDNARARLAGADLPQAVLRDLPAPVRADEIDRIVGPDAVHQGIALVTDPLPDIGLDGIAGSDVVIVLDQVTDPHNVGAILRSAAAFACGGLVMTSRHGPAETGVLAKAASGGLDLVPLVRVTNLARALGQLKDYGFLIAGLDSAYAEPIEDLPAADKTALVLGAEGRGLRRLTRESCDHLVRLEMPGAIGSLNVSNAAAVALYALRLRNRN